MVHLRDGSGNNLTEFKFIDRGYTGHKHLLGVGIVHMNGRLYDPVLHRFLSPDNYVQDPFNSQNFNRYGYVLNNPLKYSDPSGEFFWIAVGIGAAIGAITQALKPGANFGDIVGGALIGGLAGLVGAGVGSVLAGGTFFGSSIASTIGFGSGFVSGFAGGFSGGFIGGAGNAWLNGASFGEGLGAGLKAGAIGGLAGGLINGVTSGITAVKHNGNFFSGKGSVFESIANPGQSTSVGDGLEYTDKYARKFSNKHFGKVKGLNKLNANGKVPTKGGYYSNDGFLFNSKDELLNGATEYIGAGKSNVFLSKSAFSSKNILFHSLGHEYIHVTHNLMHSQGIINSKSSYKGFLRTEISAHNWNSNLGLKNGYQTWNGKLGKFSWKYGNWFDWLPNKIPSF